MRCLPGGIWVLLLLTASVTVRAAPLCATPGADGSARPAGVINHWFSGPDDTVLPEGARWIPLQPPRPSGGLASGDRVLLIQMQGARISDDNDPDYGDGEPGPPAAGWTRLRAGHFEWLRVDSVEDKRIRVRGGGTNNGLVHRYENRAPAAAGDPGRARWQLVRAPQYQQATLSGDLRALPWNGRTGGVLALDVRGTLDLNGHALDASGTGFRGGGPLTLRGALGDTADLRYRAPTSEDLASYFGHHAAKGEGLAGTPRYVSVPDKVLDTRPEADQRGRSDGYPGGSMARGAPGNAGGGGNSLSLNNEVASGGGGGGAGRPGRRGRDAEGRKRGGFGGAGLAPDRLRLIPGGGGGAGTRAHSGEPLAGAGGAGGGIVIVSASRIEGPGRISVAGADGRGTARDAGGGGGAGGTLMLLAPFGELENLSLELSGGAGGAAPAPGGDGGAGRLLFGGGISLQPPAEIPAWPRLNARRLPGAAPAWRCRPQGTLLSGVVFEDNGAGDKALDGWQQASEAGQGGWPVRVVDGQGRVHARTRTNGAGHFALKVPPTLEGTELALTVTLPEGWHAVAATEQDLPIAPLRHEQGGVWRFSAHPDVQYDGLRLGVIRAPELEEPRRRRIAPGSTQLFPFRYTPHTPGRVRFHYTGNLHAETQWNHAFFIDPDCDGESEYVDHETTRWVKHEPGRPVCVRVRVEVPQKATSGVLEIDLRAETELGDNPLGLRLPPGETGIRIQLSPDRD